MSGEITLVQSRILDPGFQAAMLDINTAQPEGKHGLTFGARTPEKLADELAGREVGRGVLAFADTDPEPIGYAYAYEQAVGTRGRNTRVVALGNIGIRHIDHAPHALAEAMAFEVLSTFKPRQQMARTDAADRSLYRIRVGLFDPAGHNTRTSISGLPPDLTVRAAQLLLVTTYEQNHIGPRTQLIKAALQSIA